MEVIQKTKHIKSLYKFEESLVTQAYLIPEVSTWMEFLDKKNIWVIPSTREGACLTYNLESKVLSIYLGNQYPNPIRRLGALCHEYWHVKQLDGRNFKHDIYKSKDSYINEMLNQEYVCYTKEAEFLLKHSPIPYAYNVVQSYRKGAIKKYVDSIMVPVHSNVKGSYRKLYDYTWEITNESAEKYGDWVV